MTSAVIVSTARTPLAKSWKGAFNMTHGATLGGLAVKAAVERAGVDGAEVDDVIMGCATPEGATGGNIARQIALRAGLPVTTSGMTVNRFCSSGLQTIALAAQRIVAGESDILVAGGVESISCVQNEANRHMGSDPWLVEHKPEIYWSMLDTAEQVARRYKIDRERMDRYGAASQQKAAAAQAAGKFDDEMIACTVMAGVVDPALGLRTKEVTIRSDEGIRARHHLRGHHGHQAGDSRRRGRGRQREPVQRRRRRLRADERGAGQQAQPEAARPLPRLCGCRLRARRDGHRPGLRRAQGAEEARPDGRRHRPVGVERGLRGAGAVLRRRAGHSDGQAERQRRRDRRRSPVWLERPAPAPATR